MPSSLSLLSLLRHTAELSGSGFGRSSCARTCPSCTGSEEHPDGDDLVTDADAAYLTFLAETPRVTQRWLAADWHELADDAKVPPGKVSLRRVYIHIPDEYAQHTGNADLVRERIDGATGA
jgi:hypothetical protein